MADILRKNCYSAAIDAKCDALAFFEKKEKNARKHKSLWHDYAAEARSELNLLKELVAR